MESGDLITRRRSGVERRASCPPRERVPAVGHPVGSKARLQKHESSFLSASHRQRSVGRAHSDCLDPASSQRRTSCIPQAVPQRSSCRAELRVESRRDRLSDGSAPLGSEFRIYKGCPHLIRG